MKKELSPNLSRLIKLAKKKITAEEGEESESEAPIEMEVADLLEDIFSQADQGSKMRVAELYGEICDDLAASIIASMFILKESGRKEKEEDGNPVQTYQPFELFISTPGGTAVDMFAIYDTMRMIREECEIHTIGMGKVMSAGVLLLAAGTKGKRRIGANCRVMIHSVMGGHQGSIHNLENEMEEVRWVQQQHNAALCEETDLTPRMLKKLLSRNVNVYLTAKEAVEYGIADIIV